MKITDIALVEIVGEYVVEGQQSEERIANPLDLYPEFGASVPARRLTGL